MSVGRKYNGVGANTRLSGTIKKNPGKRKFTKSEIDLSVRWLQGKALMSEVESMFGLEPYTAIARALRVAYGYKKIGVTVCTP